MRGWRVCIAVLSIVAGSTAAAQAQPPLPNSAAPPAIPLPPGLGLPALQQWIDAVIPPPPIVAPPGPVVAADIAPDLASLQQAVLPNDIGDPLFDRWPPDLAQHAPGDILEVRDVTPTAAPLLLAPARQVLQLKFRTTDAHDAPSFATASLVVPVADWTGPGARPVLVNNLPIDALGRACTPGYTLAHGLNLHTAATDWIPPTTQLAMLHGYAVLIPDHEGPRMAYAEPYVAGHAVLDSIRAVRALRPAEFGESRYAMHGYSGGAIATRGAVALIDSYAPELARVIVGAALGGVPADYEVLAGSMNANLASGVFLAATFGVARERPEILARMNNLGRWAAISPLKDTCVGVFALPGVLMLPIDLAADIPDPLHSELAADIYRVTRMRDMRSAVPLYIYNGEQEFWIPAAGARALFREQCALGVPAVYRSVFGEHVIAAAVGYPDAVSWVDQRLRGVAAPTEC
ncbi:lipase family protein [Nocardia sp. CDC159]|uniref:Lipase family protein n=1 Tax=Nocardia pulmonis TaxID=2951408 RepID=A0A9X2E5S9_9NOCA|nr:MULTISPECIES: lipase family protein [Nocardia]MCM6772141.1 lipase family protein [Nocardia pulmonis]MCM6785201.1 lipase family protein [Nocardia sp. CDC159]